MGPWLTRERCGGVEEGNSVASAAPVLRPVRLRSGQRGGVFDAGCFPGLRPRLVYVGPLALGVGLVDGVCEHVMG